MDFSLLLGSVLALCSPSSAMPSTLNHKNVILFDGVCNFCNRWVNFVIDNDPNQIFKFAAMQSQAGQSILKQHNRDPNDLSTFVLIDQHGSLYTQSDAALHVAKTLQQPAISSLAQVGTAVPKPLRDGLYRLIADNRYSILGKDTTGNLESCKLRAPNELGRFLG